jgi:hypothetical protein
MWSRIEWGFEFVAFSSTNNLEAWSIGCLDFSAAEGQYEVSIPSTAGGGPRPRLSPLCYDWFNPAAGRWIGNRFNGYEEGNPRETQPLLFEFEDQDIQWLDRLRPLSTSIK